MRSAEWKPEDVELAHMVRRWVKQTRPRITIKALAQRLGCSYNRLLNVLQCRNAPLTVAEFAIVCETFGKDPGQAFEDVIVAASRTAGHEERTTTWLRRAGGPAAARRIDDSTLHDEIRDLISRHDSEKPAPSFTPQRRHQ